MLDIFKLASFFISLYILPGDCFLFCQIKTYNELPGFRGVAWGSKMEQVKTAETESYMQLFHGFGIDALSYRGYFAGLNSRIDYSFKNDKLFEGTYTITSGVDFKSDFNKVKIFLIDEYGKPNLMVGLPIESDSVWIKVTDYGKFRGPELYWKFNNGFIGLIASKFDDDITITVLYSNEKSIEEYGKDRLISTDDYVK